MEEHGYKVIRPLGQGSQGRIYEVSDRQGKVCVLKQLLWVDEQHREKTLQEVHLLSSLRHPFIVPYLESFMARSTPSIPYEDVLCLVMSRCKHDLRHECLQMRGQSLWFEETRVVLWLTQLCWGLQHLHARKFLHRDIKSQNVLLTEDNRLLLADFGVAGRLEHTEGFRESIVGTPAFMSPEMLEGRPYGCKTDQWALGCVLWEIMALEPPFASCGSYAAIVVAVLHSSPMRAPHGYSQKLSSALEALLQRKPDARPSSADLLGSPLLRDAFRALLKSCTDEIRGEAAYPAPAALVQIASKDTDVDSYESDFESYSGSDSEDGHHEVTPAFKLELRGNVCINTWKRLHVEGQALLKPLPVKPEDEMKKTLGALRRTLGSMERVEQALAFLRERKPLCEESDELALQIEIVDLLGDKGINALPLLERCIWLEFSCGDAVNSPPADDVTP